MATNGQLDSGPAQPEPADPASANGPMPLLAPPGGTPTYPWAVYPAAPTPGYPPPTGVLGSWPGPGYAPPTGAPLPFGAASSWQGAAWPPGTGPAYGSGPGYIPGPAGYGPGYAWPPGPGFAPPAPGYGWPPGYGPGYGYFRPPEGPLPGVAWAGIGHRFGALLIDAAIMFGALMTASVLAAAWASRYYVGDSSDSVTYSTSSTAIIVAWVLFLFLYHPVCWYLFGGSIGQRALGLRILRAADGRRLGLGSILVRYSIFAICTATVIPGLIAAAMAADDPFKRAWHDEAARSVVVRRL